MNSQSSLEATDRLGNPGDELLRWTVGMLVMVTGAVALLMFWRRIAGALDVPLAPPLLLATGLFAAAVAVAAREAWNRRSFEAPRSHLDLALWIAPTPALIMLGMAVSLPGTSTGGLIVFWGLLLLEETWSWRRSPWRGATLIPRDEPTEPPSVEPTPEPAFHEEAENLPAVVDECPAREVTQQLTRDVDADGVERISGWLRAEFEAGQRTSVVHLSFCPPMNKTPELMVEQADGPTARIKTAQLLAHGARLDLKLSQPADEDDSVLLQFSASCPSE